MLLTHVVVVVVLSKVLAVVARAESVAQVGLTAVMVQEILLAAGAELALAQVAVAEIQAQALITVVLA